MTTTIAPASGAGALFTQQGTGTTPGYAALDDRRSNSGSLQEGVFGTSTLVTAGGVSNVAAADFMVTQRAAGANMSVDVNMPAGGFAYVQGDTINGQGLYTVPVHSANINEVIAAADATNPRIDQVILEIQDNVLDASGGNLARIRVLTGTPTGGATLANRSGAAALPGSALLLADVLVGAAVGSVANAVMRDRRKWARGASYSIARTAGSDYTTASGSFVLIDSTNLQPRIECSGAPLEINYMSTQQNNGTGNKHYTTFGIDGASIDQEEAGFPTAAVPEVVTYHRRYVPTAGSRLVGPMIAVSAGTATIKVTTGDVLHFDVQEKVVQLQHNASVTTG